MELNRNQIDVIKSNKSLLQRNDFDGFFSRISESERCGYADFFYSIGIDIFEYLTSIPNSLFRGSKQLRGVTLPENVTKIGEGAFCDCYSLENVTMSDNVTDIGSKAFAKCLSLKQVKLSNSIRYIPERCFAEDIDLQTIFIPDSVKAIKSGAFDGCDGITIYANYRENKADRLTVKQSDVEFMRKYLKFKHPKKDVQQTESLTEGLLKEDFSTSMPKWLRTRLLYNMNKGDYSKLNKYSNGQYPDIANQSRATFGSKKRTDQNYEDLYTAMKRVGIDVSNAKFIEDGLPALRKDARVEAPNIPFFHLVDEATKTDTVYGKGLNENEWFYPEDKPMKYLPLKTLLSYTKDFCWMDGTDQSNYLGTKVQDRAQMKQELRNLGDYNRYKDNQSAGISPWYDKRRLDKSGYIVDPGRFTKKLKELGKRNMAVNMAKLYDDIKYVQTQFANLLMDYDFRKNSSNAGEFNTVFARSRYDASGKLFTELHTIMDGYNQVADYVEQASTESDERRKDRLLDYAANELVSAKEKLKVLKQKASNILDVEIDWDTNESLSKKKLLLDENAFDVISEAIENLDRVDDLQPVENVVMADAQQQSKRVDKSIDDEFEDINKDLKNGFLGAKNQPVPKAPVEPKISLDESLF